MKNATVFAAMLLCLTFSVVVCAQSPAFEVASIKLGDPAVAAELKGRGGPIAMGCHGTDSEGSSDSLSSKVVPAGRCVFGFIPLRTLIILAFQLDPYQLTGIPDWVASTPYHIEAKSESPATVDQLLQMLQTLLADRFKLQVHRETKEMAGMALVIAKNGHKLHDAKSDEDQRLVVKPFKPPVQQLVGQRVSIAMLVKLMTSMGMTAERGPTIDRTGLDGFYDFEVTWQPEGRLGAGSAAVERVGPTLPVALEEQLGIRVESAKNIPVQFLIIDHVEKAVVD